MCDQCLFSPNRVVSSERMKEIVEGCKEGDTFFICHKSNDEGDKIVCRGFYDNIDTLDIRLMKLHPEMVPEIDPKELKI